MITFTNYFTGRLIRIISRLILQCSPSLKSQFLFIKNIVSAANEREIKIPKHLLNSILVIEDKRFFYHLGIDFYSIMRAVLKNATSNRLEGASTIVQQLIRNITGEREIKSQRKIKEIMYATLLYKNFTKNQILFAYLDTYKFKNCTGIFDFCRYEKYDIQNLSLTESVQIAARFKYPSIHTKNYVKYLKRVRTIEKKTMHYKSLKKNGQGQRAQFNIMFSRGEVSYLYDFNQFNIR